MTTKVEPTVEKWDRNYPNKWNKHFYSKGAGYGSEPHDSNGESACDETLVEVKGSELSKFISDSVQEAKAEERDRIIKFIRSLADLTVNGESKYWTEKAFEEYFEDRGYKFGPERFITDLLSTLKSPIEKGN